MNTLDGVRTHLLRHYGPQPSPAVRDPWLAILRLNVAYLASDARREEAFRHLTREIGTDAEQILAAPRGRLQHVVAAPGRLAASFADKLRDSARLLADEHGGDLNAALDDAGDRASVILQQFPGVGAPIADRLLLLSRRAKVLPLDSHALRVLVRVGIASAHKNYRTTYRHAQEAVGAVAHRSWTWLEQTSALLTRHGRDLCKQTRPLCERCPLRRECPSARIVPRS